MRFVVLQGLSRRSCIIHDGQIKIEIGPSVSKYEPPSITVFTLNQALDLNPVSKDIWDSILAAYAALGTPGEANKLLQKKAKTIIKTIGKKEYDKLQAYVYSEEASLAVNGADWVKQEDLFRKAAALDPDNPDYVIMLARVIHRSGHYQDSLDLLEKQRNLCKDDTCRKTIDESLQKEAFLERLVRKLE